MSAPTKTPLAKAAASNDPTASLRAFLAQRTGHLSAALPKSKGLTAEKFVKLALMATTKTPDLLKCDMSTVFQCLMQCAELGLEPSGTLGAAYLIPFNDNKNNRTVCTLVIGYRGLIDLARRSGVLKQIEAHVVHEKDRFDLRFGREPRLDHVPYLDGDPGKARLVYCVATLGDGAQHVEVMTHAEIERVRSFSRAGHKGPWVDHWEEMAKKTVARRTLRWVPMSSELQAGLEAEDDEREVGRGSTMDLGAVAAPTLPTSPAAAKAGALSKAEKEAAEIADWAEAGGPSAEAEPAKEDAPPHDPTTGEVLEQQAQDLTPAEQAIAKLLEAGTSGSALLPAIALIGKLPTKELQAFWKDRYSKRARELGAK